MIISLRRVGKNKCELCADGVMGFKCEGLMQVSGITEAMVMDFGKDEGQRNNSPKNENSDHLLTLMLF